MRFQIPQFIEVEDKIFGPFTFKQFVYLAGGVGIVFVLYRALPLLLSIFLIVPVVLFSLGLAFYKINDRPFILVVEASFKHFLRNKLYTWKKGAGTKKQTVVTHSTETSALVPHLSESKLKDISWSLDVHDSIYAGQEKRRPNDVE
ncbi:MAG TPA: PrgI family protein [Candidatus Paceibacterota bacterium]